MQLVIYLKDKGLLPDLQSAYLARRSAETAVLKVLSDILMVLDSGNLAVLMLLDLSAAFDSVDHTTLLQRLKTSYGLNDVVINWFTSYFGNRTHCVHHFSRSSSSICMLLFGVQQGSVLGPSSSSYILLTYSNLLNVISFNLMHTLVILRSAGSVVLLT